MSPTVYIPLIAICAIFVLSELSSRLIKNKIDSLLFFMIYLVIFGSILGWITEKDFDASLFSTITYGFGLPFAIISFGASVSIQEFKGQYKTFIIGTAAVATIILSGLVIGTPIVGLRTALYSAVEIAGGGQAGLIFLTKAQQDGDNSLAALILLLMNLQVCVGYPLSIYALRRGIKKHLDVGDMMTICDANLQSMNAANADSGKKSHKIHVPDFLNDSFYYVFLIFGLIALAAFWIGQKTTISHYVWEIIFGFIVVQVGILPKGALNRVGAGGLIFGCMYATICAQMCSMTWKEIVVLLPQVLLFFAVGVIGCALCGFIFGKIMKKNFWETFSVSLGCMVGFPPSLLVAESATSALVMSGQLDAEKAKSIVDYYQPQIVISGVVTISIETGIIAGIIIGII